jgi:hypothetical protein
LPDRQGAAILFIPAPHATGFASPLPVLSSRRRFALTGWRRIRAKGRREHTMSDAPKVESAEAEWMRRLAAARGLGRTFAMYPETVTAAFARASQCMTTLPANMSPVTEPMPRFDPAAVTVPE